VVLGRGPKLLEVVIGTCQLRFGQISEPARGFSSDRRAQ
jgi:hypothetical protein